MTELIKYHHKTTDLALFCSDGDYWIGSYFPQARHQNSEPPYCLIEGYWSDQEPALERLAQLKGNEI